MKVISCQATSISKLIKMVKNTLLYGLVGDLLIIDLCISTIFGGALQFPVVLDSSPI